MNHPHSRRSFPSLVTPTITVTVLLCLTLVFSFVYPWSSISYWAVDFTIFHAAASALVQGDNPYSLADLILHAPLGTINAFLMYAYPPLLIELLLPLTTLTVDTASRVWLALNLLIPGSSTLLILRSARWKPRPFTLMLLVLGSTLFLPCVYNYLSGQASLWVLLWVSAGVYLLGEGKHMSSGLSWALAWAKPHPVPFLPLVLLHRSKRALVTFVALTTLSLLVAFRWIPSWFFTALHTLDANSAPDQWSYQASALGVLTYLGAPGLIIRVLIPIVAIIALGLMQRQSIDWRSFSIAHITLGLLATPYISRSDVAVSLIPIVLILSNQHRSARPAKLLAVLAWAMPILCIFLRVALGLDWALLPLVWGSLVQWTLAAAAGWYLWGLWRSGILTTPHTPIQ